MADWRFEIKYGGTKYWQEGYESYDDAYDAMSEAMTDMIDGVAEEHPEMTDEEIEEKIIWDVRETW